MMMIMKNIKTFLIAAAAVFAISSCNLDKFPDNAINTEDAMESVATHYYWHRPMTAHV